MNASGDSDGCCNQLACLEQNVRLLQVLARMERDARDSAGRCAALEQEFPWIAGEKQLFG